MLEVRLIAIEVHDWRKIIADIKAGYERKYGRRLTNYKLGEMVELDHKQIEWLEFTEGAEPRHSKAVKLLREWESYQLRNLFQSPPLIRMQTA